MSKSVDSNALDTREKFGSRIGFVLASIGGAVGLGNVWKFPYITGKYGGAAFIVVYLIALILIGVPILMTEFALGRSTQSNYVGALKKLFPEKKWYLAGIIGVISLTITLAFYAGVAGWTIAYFFKSLFGTYKGMSIEGIGNQFGAFISSPYETILWLGLMLGLTAIIVMKGISGGIEKVCNFLLPLLFLMIIFLGIRSIMLPGSSAGLAFYLKPDFSQLTGEAVMAAIGQVFFSLGVGCGNLVIYGSYLDKKKSIMGSTLLVGVGDTLAAILFGFIIFPAVFAYGIEPSMGPPLVFITLPTIFAQMRFGMFFASTFFLLLFVACITSTICILEAIVGYGVDEWKLDRKKATIIATTIIFVLGIFMMLSFGTLSHISIFGHSIFDFSNDILVSTILLPGGALLMVLLIGWKVKPENLLDEINTGEGIKVNNYYRVTIKYIAPIALIAMFLQMIGVLRF